MSIPERTVGLFSSVLKALWYYTQNVNLRTFHDVFHPDKPLDDSWLEEQYERFRDQPMEYYLRLSREGQVKLLDAIWTTDLKELCK